MRIADQHIFLKTNQLLWEKNDMLHVLDFKGQAQLYSERNTKGAK